MSVNYISCRHYIINLYMKKEKQLRVSRKDSQLGFYFTFHFTHTFCVDIHIANYNKQMEKLYENIHVSFSVSDI